MLKTLSFASVAALVLISQANANGRVKRVEFTSGGERLVGDLYIPDGVDSTRPAPALVVTGAWMTVKEQMPARYAQEMANRGFLALTFDFRGWGESGGVRRQFEDPETKIEDIAAAITYLATRPETDKARIGGLGICASSGYMVHAATRAPTIRSVALVAPWLHDRKVLEQAYGGSQNVEKLIATADAVEAEYRQTRRQSFVPAASLTDERAIMFRVPYYTEVHRGMIPSWRNEADLAFWRGWLSFDAIRAATHLTQPLLMVHSEAAAIPQGAHRFFGELTRAKQELWLDNVGQFDFYDRAGPVKASADAAASHFHTTLAVPERTTR